MQSAYDSPNEALNFHEGAYSQKRGKEKASNINSEGLNLRFAATCHC